MKSALEIIAFSNRSQFDGTVALLEAALDALDRSGNHLPAALVDLALQRLLEDVSDDCKPVVLLHN